MATRIPLPGLGGEALQRGVEAGTGMFNQLIGQGVNLGKMYQQGQQFEKELAQRWQQHLQEMEIRRAYHAHLAEQEKRLWAQHQLAAQLQPWQIKLLEQQAGHHQAQTNDLTFQQDYMNRLLNGGNIGEEEEILPNLPTYSTVPDINLGSIVPSIPGYTFENPQPERLPQSKNPKINKQAIISGLSKKKFGFDPFEETQDQKDMREMEKFKEKENYKAEQKKNSDLTELTPASRTKYQEVIREVDSIMPVLDELIEKGGERTTFFGTAKDTSYERKVKRIADVYMKAKGWPNTDTARNDAIQLFKRRKTESDDEYKAEMQALKAELMHERNLSESALSSGKVNNNHSVENNDPFGLRK